MLDQQRRELTRAVLDKCAALGFAAGGVCAAEPTSYGDAVRRWLRQGMHGEMTYLADHVEKRLDPRALMEGARSLICVADAYAGSGSEDDEATVGREGRIARYARGRDYHTVIKRRLRALCDELRGELRGEHPEPDFKVCVDTAPLLEREHAERAGIGAVGKHTLLITRGGGSYLLLGIVVTSLDLEPSNAADPDPCGTCTRCIDACPTDAITPWTVDATRCISYLTIEHRSAIEPALHNAHGDWLFGCDICQEVCPHNQPTERRSTAEINPAYEPRRTGFDVLEVLNWSEDDRRAAFVTSALKRARLDMMKRNALIVAGNLLRTGEDDAMRARVAEVAEDEDEPEMVRVTARDVLRGLA